MKRPWSEEEKVRLKALRLDPARRDREELTSLASHFKSGGSTYSVTDTGKPMSASQGLARKIKALTDNGALDWVLDTREPSRGNSVSAAYGSTLHQLAAAIREQLTVPLPDSRIREESVSKSEFLPRIQNVPGGSWYWGWEADEPLLVAEMHSDYPVLRELTVTWTVWEDLDGLRKEVGEYVNTREDLLREIEAQAQESTGLESSDTGRATGGSITGNFAVTVYAEAIRQITSGDHTLRARYAADESHLVGLPGSLFSPGKSNTALTVNGVIVAWLPPSPDLLAPSLPNHPVAAQRHAQLTADWRQNGRLSDLINRYRQLDSRARSQAQQLAPPNVQRRIGDSLTANRASP